VLATVATAKDRAARQRLQGRIEAILVRHGDPDAARTLRTSSARPRTWAASIHGQGAGLKSFAQRIADLLATVGASLSVAERDEVAGELEAGELRLAIEQLVDFLGEKDAQIPAGAKAECQALLIALGSPRTGEHLVVREGA
jgi:hypothetical protein